MKPSFHAKGFARRSCRAVFLPALALLLPGCANQVFLAYQSTPALGQARKIVSINNTYYFQFPYRGGFVTYEPKDGAFWRKTPLSLKHAGTVNDKNNPPSSASLINGCLVYACERAEIIRRGGLPGAKRSQVIGYQRMDNSGHSFAIYDFNGRTIAEDDQQRRVDVSPWTERTPAQALKIAREFCRKVDSGNLRRTIFNRPRNAIFYGEY